MKFPIRSMLKLGWILAAFTTTICVLLAFVYTGTMNIIDQRQKAGLQAALKEIFPDADDFEPAEGIVSPDAAVSVDNAYRAMLNGKTIGAALQVSRAGYSGTIKILAGVSVDGIITRIKILEHSETPGLGANADSASYFVDRAKGITFYGQFSGKSINDPFEAKGDVAAITASTITSRAVAHAVKAAGLAANAWFKGGAK